MTIVLSGTMGRSGLGGQAWAVLQYLLGLRALGHEVFYLEDCGDVTRVWNWECEEWIDRLDYPAAFVNKCLAPFGLGARWIYRNDTGSLGIPLKEFQEICAAADLFLMRAAPLWNWRKEYDGPRRRAFIDVDPGFTQMTIANGDPVWTEFVGRTERRFTVGQRIGVADCAIPQAGGPWLKTLPPVYLQEWQYAEGDATHFTSVIRWQGFREINHQGVAYGQRDKEFPRFFDLPRCTAQPFRIAQMGVDPELLARRGWQPVPGEVVSRTPDSYREFIQQSRAEFGVPKHGYVKMHGGWFSDRSVCYLASGRPVLIGDTGLHDWLPVGDGLLTFTGPEQAVAGIHEINSRYEHHRRAARQLAETTFSTEQVLPNFLDAAMS